MALSFVQSKSAKDETGASSAPSVTLTGGTPAQGDLLFVEIVANQNAGDVTISAPAGYTAVTPSGDGDVSDSADIHIRSFWKIAGASESTTITGSLSAAREWSIYVAQFHDSFGGTWTLDQVAHNGSPGGSTTVTTGTTPTTTVANEVCVAGYANKNQATASSPTNGFTLQETQVASSAAATRQSGGLLYKIVTGTGTQATGVTLSTSRTWVAHIATFYSVPVPATITVEAAFGYTASSNTPVWTDITSYVKSISWRLCGRQNELDQTQAGTGSLVIADPSSAFDSRNASSPFYPNVKCGVPYRAYVTTGAATLPLFWMVAERQPRTLRVTDHYTERQLGLIDPYALFAAAGISGDSYVQQTTSARFAAVLDNISFATTRRSIGTGVSTIQAKTFPNHTGDKALAHMLAVVDSENGVSFCDQSGYVVFIGRHELIQNAAYTVSAATFRDAAGASGIPYTDLEPSEDLDNVINKAVGTREGGVAQTFKDLASKAQFFVREKQFQSLVVTDGEVLNQMQWKIGQFSQPLNRVERITVKPCADLTDASTISGVLGRKVAERITVKETPPGFGAEQSVQYVIQNISGSVSVPLSTLEMQFGLWPASTSSFWVAGDAVQSLAGISTRPGY